jgi:hypothetical protein
LNPLTNPIDAAYLAGLFDGEGCVHIMHDQQRVYYYQLVVTVANTHKPTIDRLKEVFGGVIQEQERAKTCYVLALRSLKARAFLEAVYPYLRIKRSQADLALAFQTHMSSRGGITPEVIAYRQTCKEQMHELKEQYASTD